MPYIKEHNREILDDALDDLCDQLSFFEPLERDGCLNYVISRLLGDLYERKYSDLNAAIGILECCKLELYRRVVAPYEDIKIIENGDVY